MNIIPKLAAAMAFVLAGSTAQADRKEDTFYILLDNASDNPVQQDDMRTALVDMLLADARDRGLAQADTVILRADRSVGVWNDDILTSRNLSPERLRELLFEKLGQVSGGPETSRLMRLLQTTRIDCSAAETVTVYVVSNFVSSTTLDDDGAHLETAPSVSLNGCALVWVGPTLGSPQLGLREVQHIDDLLAKLSAHLKADDYVIVR